MGEFKLGDKVVDSISGYQGVINAVCHYQDRPTVFLVIGKPPTTGGPIPEEWLPASRLSKSE